MLPSWVPIYGNAILTPTAVWYVEPIERAGSFSGQVPGGVKTVYGILLRKLRKAGFDMPPDEQLQPYAAGGHWLAQIQAMRGERQIYVGVARLEKESMTSLTIGYNERLHRLDECATRKDSAR